jgi:hypothetical protein
MSRLKVAAAVLCLALVAMPAWGIEEAPVTDTPQGIGWLFLFIGIGAITIVGFVMYARERARDNQPESSGSS